MAAGSSSTSSSDLYHIIDDKYLSSLYDDDDEIYLVSDEKYAEQLQLQEALVYSSTLLTPSVSSPNIKNTSSLSYSSSSSSFSLKVQPLVTSFCNICMDSKAASEMFKNTNACGHLFCSDCIREYVEAKIKENLITVTCPDPSCEVIIGPEACTSTVPKEVMERWENILCESVIKEAHKFYCPFKDCSAMLADDGGEAVTSAECPNCNRLFCAQCKVAWHCGIDCIEFRSLKKGERKPDDILFMNLAKSEKWMKCSECNYIVSKVDGCQHITCKCGHEFCYGCGQPYNSAHVCA